MAALQVLRGRRRRRSGAVANEAGYSPTLVADEQADVLVVAPASVK